jgi:hypothetical protein
LGQLWPASTAKIAADKVEAGIMAMVTVVVRIGIET